MNRQFSRKSAWLLVALLVLFNAGGWLLGSETKASPADWVAAFSTEAAFVAAVIAGWYVARAYDVELKREQDRDDQAKRAQASLVAFWYDIRLGPLLSGPGGGIAAVGPASPWTAFGIWLRNASELPVFDVRVEVFVEHQLLGSAPMAAPETGRVGVVPPSSTPHFQGFGEVIGKALEGLRPPPDSDGSIPDPPVPVIALYFTDSAGQGWLRMSDGALIEGEKKPANRWGA